MYTLLMWSWYFYFVIILLTEKKYIIFTKNVLKKYNRICGQF